MRIRFDNEQDRLDVYGPMRHFIDCGVLTLNMTNNRLYQVPVSAQSVRMEFNSPREHWRPMTYDLDVDLVHLKPVAIVPARESNDLLRAQLAARDAAMDAVLDWADLSHPRADCDSPRESNMRKQVAALLAAHGVHPK